MEKQQPSSKTTTTATTTAKTTSTNATTTDGSSSSLSWMTVPPPAFELTADQLRDVCDVVRQPLKDRRVMIPLIPPGGCNSKAFVLGTLCPDVCRPDNEDNGKGGVTEVAAKEKSIQKSAAQHDNKQELGEQVIVLVKQNDDEDGTKGGKILNTQYRPVQMTRQQARDHIEREMKDKLSSKNKKKLNNTAIPSTKTTTNSPATVTKSILKGGKKSASTQSSSSSLEPPSFFEIREEIDEQGNAIRGEKLEVTNDLHNLTKEFGESATPPPFPTNDEIKEDCMELLNYEEKDVKDNLTDHEYKQLASRLDELARLEEEAEHNKTINQKSRTKLQSKGWSKGFLNNSSTNKKKKPKAPAKNSPVIGKGAEVVATNTQNKQEETSSVQPSKTVKFDSSNDQVQEIPRIGERSVSAIRDQIRSSSNTSGITTPTATHLPKPMEETVLSGVVKERKPPVRRKAKPKPVVQQPPPPSERKPEAPQRISRFALERQQMQG